MFAELGARIFHVHLLSTGENVLAPSYLNLSDHLSLSHSVKAAQIFPMFN